MFKNMGGKIKKLTKFCCWVSIIIWVLVGMALMMSGMLSLDMIPPITLFGVTFNSTVVFVVLGALVMVLGVLGSWIGSLFFYGLGELIENNSIETAVMVKREMEMRKEGF